MTDANHADDRTSIVQKDLDDADRTDGFRTGHYSREDVLAACHAEDGGDHE
jgi:hypothetical protein